MANFVEGEFSDPIEPAREGWTQPVDHVTITFEVVAPEDDMELAYISELEAERDRWQRVHSAEVNAHHQTGAKLDRMTAERDALRACLREMTDEAQAMGDVLELDFGKYPTNTREILERHGVAHLLD